jgi:hypothetical protein
MPDLQMKKVACPSCGASLLFGAGEITTRCMFCHAVIERPLQADQPAMVKPGPAVSPPSRPRTGSSPANPISIFSFLALGLGLVVAIAAFVMAMIFADNGPSSGSQLILNGEIAALPTDNPEGPDFIALVYDLTGDKNLLVRLDPIRGKIVWRGKEIKDTSDIQALVVGDARFFTVEGSTLHAYRSADGSELWQAQLSDKLGYGEGALSAAGNRVVALTQDYVIEAFDSETGASAWKRRMDGYTLGYTILDGGLWVIDKLDGRQTLLHLSLADGSIRRLITPVCARSDGNATSELSSTSLFLFDPDPSVDPSHRSLYILYGWSPGCIERWDAASATRIWQTVADEGFSASTDYAALITPQAVYFADGEKLWSASTADGQTRLLSEGGDYELVPLAAEQDVLILRTKRTRGSTQFGLRGFDPVTGKILWDHAVPNSAPYDPPEAAFRYVEEDEAIWTWRISGGFLHLYTFQANPNQLSLATLDPQNGTYADGEAVALDISDDSYFGPTILLRKDAMLWALAGSKIYGIDLATAKIKYQFP